MTRSELQRAIYRLIHGTDVMYWEVEERRFLADDEIIIHFTNLSEEPEEVTSTIGG
tara:strand:- start:590 stop:757 length:168 start_codon:yes stop_codon:yes gene_type:complete